MRNTRSGYNAFEYLGDSLFRSLNDKGLLKLTVLIGIQALHGRLEQLPSVNAGSDACGPERGLRDHPAARARGAPAAGLRPA